MLIREVLAHKTGAEIISVDPEVSACEAVKLMAERDIGSLVVMRDGAMMGFITERDILRGMHARGCAPIEIKVSELMEKEPLVANLDDSVDYARDAMTKSHTSHLVVLDVLPRRRPRLPERSQLRERAVETVYQALAGVS